MAKSRKTNTPPPERKSNSLAYGIVILIAGALIGVAFSTAFRSTTASNPVPAQVQGGDLFSQIQMYSDRVAANPQDGNAWVTLGNLYFDTDQPVKSIEAYSRALAINPDNPNVLTDMGVMHRAVGEFQKALDAFAKAIAINPGHETARMNTGVVLLYDLKDKEAAIAAWQALVHVNPQAKNAEGRLVTDMIKQLGGTAGGPQPGNSRLLAPVGGS